MMGRDFECAECERPIGGQTGRDAYKHTVQCFKLPDRGRESLKLEAEKDRGLRGQKILRNLSAGNAYGASNGEGQGEG